MNRLYELITILPVIWLCVSCHNNSTVSAAGKHSSQSSHSEVNTKKAISELNIERTSTFIVISKIDLTLSVYAYVSKDTLLLDKYPVCIGKNEGQKEKRGDMRTPECDFENPFTIIQIQDASDWYHDFKDGRGSIKAYGHWFLRLSTPPFSGIGIHGSTNNESSVPGRGSEGCIRLKDDDIIQLKEKYAWVGMPVIIKHEHQGMLSFE